MKLLNYIWYLFFFLGLSSLSLQAADTDEKIYYNDYNQAANLIENASDETIEALSQSQKDYVKAIMPTEHQALKAEGALSDDLKIPPLARASCSAKFDQ